MPDLTRDHPAVEAGAKPWTPRLKDVKNAWCRERVNLGVADWAEAKRQFERFMYQIRAAAYAHGTRDRMGGGNWRSATGSRTAAERAARLDAELNDADDLRHTPAGNALIREGMALSGKVGYEVRLTPGGRAYNPGIPGDRERASHEEALARAATHNLRESAEGRALMAEAWEEGAATAWTRTAEGFNAECACDHLAPTGDDPYVEFREANPDVPNPYREARP